MRSGALVLAVLVLLAPQAASAASPAACAALMSAEAKSAALQSNSLPGLATVKDAIASAAQEAGRGDVSCGDVSRGDAGEGLQCYNGSQVALIGQAPRLSDGVPLLVASFGDGVERRIAKEGVFVNGAKWRHLEGNPLVSALRARQLFCEAVVGGDPRALVVPISNPGGPGDGPQAVPAIYYGPREEPTRVYKI